MTKGQIRRTLLRRLKQQKEDERTRKSAAIRRKVFRLPAFRRATTVCCYVALPYEVQTWRMIEEMLVKGKRVAVPVTAARARRLTLTEVRDPATELVPGRFGVWEPRPEIRRPVPLGDVDLWLVPALAFDRHGHRLGHGYGYFDRLLARIPKTTPTVGLAFQFQLLDHLPLAAHDRAVQTILTA